LYHNEEAPPLQAPTSARVLSSFVHLYISFVDIHLCLFRVLFRALNHGILGFHNLSHISKHSGKLGQALFNLLKFVMSGAYGTENRSCLTRAIRLELCHGQC
jgi:hypothetical protein